MTLTVTAITPTKGVEINLAVDAQSYVRGLGVIVKDPTGMPLDFEQFEVTPFSTSVQQTIITGGPEYSLKGTYTLEFFLDGNDPSQAPQTATGTFTYQG